jgi:uncharacterized protein
MALDVQPRAGGVCMRVHVQPRASRTELAGVHGDALKVRLRAPPVDGAANEELAAYLGELFGVPRPAIRIVRGQRGRAKLVEVDGVDVATVRRLVGDR